MERKCRGRVWALALLSSILLQAETTSAANILAFFPFASRSHDNFYSAITRALAERGHHLTVVTPLPIHSPPPNYRQIDVSDVVGHNFSILSTTRKVGIFEMLGEMSGLRERACRLLTGREGVKSLADPGEGPGFDLILIGVLFCECLYPFARAHDAPAVLMSPAGPMHLTLGAVGHFVLPSHHADPLLGYGDRMTLKERILNTMAYVGLSMLYRYHVQSAMESDMRASFGEDTPSIAELEEYVSLAVVNNHFSLNQARQTVPSLVEAGGLHIKPPKELPEHLKSFLDGAGKDGVIYFSLGSILKSSRLPLRSRDELIAAFSKVKQRVLWKWDGENPIPGQSKNVRLEKWLPQQDVLAHPNVKLFITHGGLLSFQEAASRGVPLIGIPHFGDQEMNMNRVLQLKVGVKVDADNLTASNLLGAINEVLENPIYSMNMKRIQSIVSDQMDDPLERAVYWIEYVIRHKGAKHLKPAAFYLQWYQICMLDVLFVLVVIPTLVSLGIGLFCFKVIKRLRSSRRKTTTSLKKTQ